MFEAGHIHGRNAGLVAPEADGVSDSNFFADQTLFNLLPDALITVDNAGLICDVNPQCCAMFGYEAEELTNQPVEILVPDSARKTHAAKRRAYQATPAVRPMGNGNNLHGRRKDGTEFPVDIMIAPIGIGGKAALAVIRDTTASRNAQEKFKLLAHTDPLTGLGNRTALYNDLNAQLQDRQALDLAPLAIALFDLDGFKEVNDTLGHSAGDTLLRIAAERAKHVIDSDVRIYRLGGDELVVTIEGCGDPARAIDIVRRLIEVTAQPFDLDQQQAFVTVSAGVAFAPEDGQTVDELLANVDLALYRSKALGGNTHTCFTPAFRAEALARRALGLKLRQAFAEDRFEIFFQPTVRLADRSVVGAEALLRWRENGRLIAPAAFIDALAASSLALELGDWIVRTACAQAAAWNQPGDSLIRIGVNLFSNQFNDPAFADRIEGLLAEHSLPPGALQLEITETIALDNSAAVRARLRRLLDAGLSLALDDFGTGHASLSFLSRAPLTHIKIDQSFVRGLPDDKRLTSIVRALVDMAHGLGLTVTAEGVETEAQAVFLREIGCDEAQGFLFSRALPADCMAELFGLGPGFAADGIRRGRSRTQERRRSNR